MNLAKKKILAAKALKVGKNRVIFSKEGLSEIKEAITKDDVKTLFSEGIIAIKPVKGRKTVKKRRTRRGPGKIKKKVNHRKQVYVKITRKLRSYVRILRDKGEIEKDLYYELRKKIRMRAFKSKANLKEYLAGLEKGIIKKVEKKVDKKSVVSKEKKSKPTNIKEVKNEK